MPLEPASSRPEQPHSDTTVILQTIARRLGLHERLRVSCLYDLYWALKDHERIDSRTKELNFYRDLLEDFQKGDIVFDIGANVGDKTDLFLRLGAEVLAVEPDDICRNILKGKFLTYRLRPKPLALLGKAVSDTVAIKTMWIDGPGSALNTLSNKWVDTLKGNKARFEHTRCRFEFQQHRELETTTLDELILAHGVPFFVKIDVEGHEASVLRGLHRPVPYISFEVNLPEFRPEGHECIHLLSQLVTEGQFNYTANCQNGLLLPEWVDHSCMHRLLDECREPSVELFWASANKGRHNLRKGAVPRAQCAH